MDYVLGGPGYPATEGQKAWIAGTYGRAVEKAAV